MKILFLGYPDCHLLDFLRQDNQVFQTMQPVKDRVLARFDLVVSFGYRHILRPQALACAPRMPLNLHISWLPWNRGADPNYWSFAQNTPKGVTIHEMNEEADAGPIIVQKAVIFTRDEDSLASTHQRLIREIQQLFIDNWHKIREHDYRPYPQPEGGSYHRVGEMPSLPDGWNTEVRMLTCRDAHDRRHELLAYWCNPPPEDRNCPMDYYTPDGWIRSGHLAFFLINHLNLSRDASILEIGSGVGRNLAVLRFAGYNSVSGIEVSKRAIETMREMMPVLVNTHVFHGAVEEVIYTIASGAFDLLFTMAVLEHLPPESEHVFSQIVRVSKKFILTIEDEKGTGDRHFPRDYKKVFEPLGMRQTDVKKEFPSLPRGFRLRLFQEEAEEAE